MFMCVFTEGGWSDTFIIHYVHSKRNVTIWVISRSCWDLLVGGGGSGGEGGLLTEEETEVQQK